MGFFFFRKRKEEKRASLIAKPIHTEVKDVSLPPAFLIHIKIHGDSPAYILPINREFFIGSNSKNELCLEGKDVSDIHAKIRPEKDGYILYDLSSKSGVYVNWEKTLKHKLEHKNRIRIGSHILIFEFVKEEETFFDGVEIKKPSVTQKHNMTLKFLVSSEKKLEEYSGIVKDISIDGARIETERELQKGTIIEVGISSPELSLIEVIAQVIWERVQDKDDKILYDIGLQFLEMDEKSIKRLKDYLTKDVS